MTSQPTAATTPAPSRHPAAGIDFDAIKQRQQSTWASGDYAIIGSTLQLVGELLAEAADVRADERVLDVAAGNGNASLAAARRFAQVTSTDYVPHLLDRGAARAKAEGLQIAFRVADVEKLSFADEEFDVVLSTFGVMFAPDQERAASELLRVTRSGGRIGLASWTPEGFIGDLFRLIARFSAPPPGLRSPMLWGSEPHIVQMFGSQAADIRSVRRNFQFRYRSAAHWIEVFRSFYGPTHKLYAVLDSEQQTRLSAAITELLERLNTGGQRSLVVPGEYLEVVITKQ